MQSTEDFLAHYGVKGMKWDSHKTKPVELIRTPSDNNHPANAAFGPNVMHPRPGQVSHDKTTPKKDVDWAQKAATADKLNKVANKSHNEFQDKFKELLKSPRFKEVAALIKARKDDPASAKNPKVIAFFKQAKKIHDDIWEKNSADVFGQSPSKKYKLVAERHPDGTVTSKLVKTTVGFTTPGKKLPTDATRGPRKLQHAAEDFDESKVHRDGDGQFAKKDDSLENPADIEWLLSLKDVKQNIYQATEEHLKKLYDRIVASAAHDTPVKEVKAKLFTAVAKVMDEKSKEIGVSPSGTQRVGYFVNKNKTRVYAKAIPYKTPATPISKTVHDTNVAKITNAAISALPKHRTGGLFNPDADISAGRVTDVVKSPSILDEVKSVLLATVKHDDVSGSVNAPATIAAIMAIPTMLDPIRLVGDEEKHATLLYFGETSTLPADAQNTLLDVLLQVAKTTSPFRERIIETSRLGSEDPPALVTMLSDRFLSQIRNALQVSPQVRGYLANASQHPQFTPHVTLAYPDYAGEAQLRQIISCLWQVRFDRLSLWWNDERFDISLTDDMPKEPESDSAEAGWSDDPVVNFLAHFGIKGMRWGIRRERGPGGTVESGVKLHEDNSFEIPSLHKMPVGSVASIHTGEAAPKLMKKRSDGRWEETHLSADAERFAKTRSKAQHELSDREINEATKRAEAIRKYNELFNPVHDPNKELADKVRAMELQVNYAKYHAQLHPSFGTRVSGFIKSNEKLFNSLGKTLVGPTGKKIADYLKDELGGITNAGLEGVAKGTSAPKQTATLPFSGGHNGPHSNPSHGAPPKPKRNILGRKKKPTPFDPKAFK